MLKLEYDHTNYEELLQFFAKTFKHKLKDNTLTLPPEIGTGYFKYIQLSNGLQGLISDYTVHKDITFQRTKIKEDYFSLRFDEVYTPDSGDENGTAALTAMPVPTIVNPAKSAVFLGSTRFDWLFITPANSRVKGVDFIFSKEWMSNFIGMESVGGMIKKYLSLKMSAFNYEPMDVEYKRILSEIVTPDVDPSYERLVVQNRVMLLLERFFTRINDKMSDMHFDVKVSNEDITRLKKIEAELVKDFSVEPLGIAKLARMAAMSPSKLKNSFKEIYGLPIYQYYQKQRMNKAKAMLLSQKYTVRDVGIDVGFSNLSNFAKAFKKSFDQLPSDLLYNR